MQGSEEWFKMKLGVVSASNAKFVLAGAKTETRLNYVADLVGQVCTRSIPEISSPALEWGREYEGRARSAYEFKNNCSIIEQPFIYKDESKRSGASPDGFVDGESKGVEIKCPYTSKNFVKFAGLGKEDLDYVKQVQFNMWVTGKSSWDLVYYDYRFEHGSLFVRTYLPDESMFKKFEAGVSEIAEQMDIALHRLGYVFGDQWKDDIKRGVA